jgi:hypothetical protein
MDLGFETIGNATLLCHDRGPVVVTDPWIVGPAYFGSWTLSHEIPDEQREAVLGCQYVWLSHGHPDHLSGDSLNLLKGKRILLPDHHGARIKRDLEGQGFAVEVLADRRWYQLSPRIRVLCVADYNQDAILLVEVGGVLVANLNDASDRGWGKLVKNTIKGYKTSFLLALSGYGDADLINYFDEAGQRILPPAAKKVPPGRSIARRTELLGARFFIPFSSMHRYQRSDSFWADEFSTPIDAYALGFESTKAELLPAYVRYHCDTGKLEEIRPTALQVQVLEPEAFGDNWSEMLGAEDVEKLRDYFKAVRHLEGFLGYLNFRVGGRDNIIDIGRHRRGITFEVPRHSLMCAVEWQIFDDLLISNFLKATLHGDFGDGGLYPDFTPFVAKYSDNGLARTPEELEAYFAAYRQRAPIDFLRHRLEQHAVRSLERGIGGLFRSYVPRESRVYQAAKKAYWGVRARL